MAKVRAQQPLVLSVLDRLLDNEPDVSREALPNRNQILRDLKQAVRRDLENLLNTRVRYLLSPLPLRELKQSLVNFGIPDFTGANLSTAKARQEFGRVLQGIIRQYEPRFKTVQVEVHDNAQSLDRTLRFRIDALLYAEPAPEPVAFDSILKPVTGNFEVKGVS